MDNRSGKKLEAIFRLVRVGQWYKNLAVLFPLLFAPEYLLYSFNSFLRSASTRCIVSDIISFDCDTEPGQYRVIIMAQIPVYYLVLGHCVGCVDRSCLYRFVMGIYPLEREDMWELFNPLYDMEKKNRSISKLL